jgi:hypothetical protein
VLRLLRSADAQIRLETYVRAGEKKTSLNDERVSRVRIQKGATAKAAPSGCHFWGGDAPIAPQLRNRSISAGPKPQSRSASSVCSPATAGGR